MKGVDRVSESSEKSWEEKCTHQAAELLLLALHVHFCNPRVVSEKKVVEAVTDEDLPRISTDQ
jgi:hypothetical protein